MSGPGPLARYAYRHGEDPLGYAERAVMQLIEIHETVIVARADEPSAFPGYTVELTRDALARRILGELLDAGWTMPGDPESRAAS